MVSNDQAGNGLRLNLSGLFPVLVHVGAQRDERALRHPPCSLLPRLQVGEREGMVRILGEIRRVVEHHQRQDHLLQRDLVHGDAGLGEMRRRIDMGPVLPDHLIEGRAEAVLVDRVGPWSAGRTRRHLRLAEAGPDRRSPGRSCG